MRIECPSGLTGEIRGLTVGEASLLTDRKASRGSFQGNKKAPRGSNPIDLILRNNWVETIDPGPYEMGSDGKPIWSKVLTADRFFTALNVRIATHGVDFDFKIPCENCRENIEWYLDLLTLPVKKVPEESLKNFMNGNRFETKIAGKLVAFRLQDGELERRVQQAARGSKDPLTAVLAQQVLEVQNEKNKIRWIKNLGLADGFALRDAFDEVDGGVETEFEIICDRCGAEQTVELPFSRREFWAPSRRRRKKEVPEEDL